MSLHSFLNVCLRTFPSSGWTQTKTVNSVVMKNDCSKLNMTSIYAHSGWHCFVSMSYFGFICKPFKKYQQGDSLVCIN